VTVRAEDSLEAVVNSAWSSLMQGSAPQVGMTERTINRMPALLSSTRAYSRGTAVDLGIAAYRFAPDTVYLFTTVAPAGNGAMFEPLLGSLRRLDPAEAKGASAGKRIQVVTVKPGDTVRTLAARMAPPYNRPESLLALNGIREADVRPGTRLKLIVG
jgi:predicted Zn-dependent protease